MCSGRFWLGMPGYPWIKEYTAGKAWMPKAGLIPPMLKAPGMVPGIAGPCARVTGGSWAMAAMPAILSVCDGGGSEWSSLGRLPGGAWRLYRSYQWRATSNITSG